MPSCFIYSYKCFLDNSLIYFSMQWVHWNGAYFYSKKGDSGLTVHFFLSGEVKTLLLQLLRGVQHLHDNWIIHRDLKTSNLLLSHKGILKV